MNVHERANSLEPMSVDVLRRPPRATDSRPRGRRRPIADVAVSGSVAAFLVILSAVFAQTAVIDGTPFFHPLATLAFIGAFTALVGGRIRTLSALEEGYIDAGLDDSQARGRAKETLDRMTKRGIDRSGP